MAAPRMMRCCNRSSPFFAAACGPRMPVIAVVNRKGGSGKSTLATHLAVHLATAGTTVLLGDVDHQHSTQGWLRRRSDAQRGGVLGWPVDPKAMVRPPAGAGAVVLDTPGGLRGFELARVVMYADAILMPVCHSAFDRESAAACYAELLTLPRVASGRCRLAAIGMRIDGRTRGADTLADWACSIDLPYIGTLREAQAYVRCIESGLTLFDLPAKDVQADLAQWAPILEWVGQALSAGAAAQDRSPVPRGAPAVRIAPPAGPAVAARDPVPAHATPLSGPPRPTPVRTAPAGGLTRLLDTLAIPRFLQRNRSA
jgi:chromosome partitioning protein